VLDLIAVNEECGHGQDQARREQTCQEKRIQLSHGSNIAQIRCLDQAARPNPRRMADRLIVSVV
jgi:hypothetical protein